MASTAHPISDFATLIRVSQSMSSISDGVFADGVGVEQCRDLEPGWPIVDIFPQEIPDFSKYRLGTPPLRWTRTHAASDLAADEQGQWKT
jgi:hypothetical protein